MQQDIHGVAANILPSTTRTQNATVPLQLAQDELCLFHLLRLIITLFISVQLNPTNYYHELQRIKAPAIKSYCTALNVILLKHPVSIPPNFPRLQLCNTSAPKALQTFDVHVLKETEPKQAQLCTASPFGAGAVCSTHVQH